MWVCADSQTSWRQAAAESSIEAGPADARIWIKHAAQLDLAKPSYLSVTAPFILEWQLITVQHQWAQASLEAILCSLRAPCSTVSESWHSVVSSWPHAGPLALPVHWPYLGPKEKGRVWCQRPKTDRSSSGSAALHITVIQWQKGIVCHQFQSNWMPKAIIYRSVRDTHNA